jgi:tetratricopeptide (TPR) repeat protein
MAKRHRAWMAALGAAAVTAVAALAGFPGRAGAPVAELERQFRDAGRAYGEGRFRDAARLYEGLTQRGYAAPELFFNLGNAHLKDGRLGPAVLSYRKAWRLAPRDPDVDANLRLALQAAGAAEADLSSVEIAFTLLSEGEWAAVATIAWWTACLGFSLALVFPRRRALPLRLAAAAALLAALALCGLWAWRGFESSPELVVLHDTRNALTAPLASAPPSFSLPEGSVIRARGYQGEWVNVTHGQLSGWIRRSDCEPVLLAASSG